MAYSVSRQGPRLFHPNKTDRAEIDYILLDIFQLPRTLGFQDVAHLRLTLFKRGDLSSVIQKHLTTSLVVTCDSVNFLLGNHTKCFNKVIFS